MSQFVNIKKLTANSLLGVLLAGGLIVESSNTRVEANAFTSCNNSHRNNAASTVYFNLDSDGSEAYVTVTGFDPSNPSNNKKNKLIAALRDRDEQRNNIDIDYSGYSGSGLTANEALYVANNVEDLEENCDSDGDGYNDATEGQEDLDGDGIPNYMDADSSHMSNTITLTGTIRDFQASHPDFEFNLDDGDGGSQTTGLDTGIVTDTIGADKKPVYAHGNGSTTTTNGETNFNQWYNDVSGVNQSKQHSITLVEQADGTYQYSSNNFFPINDELFGNIQNDPSITTPTSGWMANQWNNGKKNNNYHFTYELHHSFTYQAGEDQEFTFSGDDDVWVYINGKRVIDIGGVHTPETRTVNLDDLASQLGLVDGGTYDFDFFFAERNFSGSNFTITTSIELEPEAPTLTTLPTPPTPTPTPTEENYCDVSSDVTNDSGILVTLEDAGVQTSQISSNNYVFDFNNPSFSSGGMTRTHAAITYTYEGNYTLSDANKWGGANLSRYIRTTPDVADCFRVLVDQDRKYFGFWWSAGDAYNKLTFKNDGVEVAVFVTEDLKNFIENTNTTDTSAYYGNPNGGNNSASNQEPYSFVNIFFDDNVAYDEIIFETTTDNGASFESDNHTFSTSSDPRGNRVTNDAPIAGDDSGEVQVTQTIVIDLLANDSDPDLNLNTNTWTTEDLSVSKIEGIDVTGGATVYLYKNGNDIAAAASPDTSNSANYIGEASINNNGELEFTAAYLPNMNPGYNIEYTVSDVFGDSDPSSPGTDNGTATIKVRPFSD